MKFEWEEINNFENGYGQRTFRGKIYGGWIIKSITHLTFGRYDNDYEACSESMIFVPDANHEWVIEK